MLKHRPTPATVISLVALFVALGGTTYAAATIGSAQIKNNSIRSKDIRKSAVAASDIRAGAVRSSDVRNGSLQATDFAAGQLPAGATGPQGPKGDKGDAGPAGVPGTARAYGTVGTDGSPTTYAGNRMKNATVRKPPATTGVYCIDPADGIDVATTIPVVSADWSQASAGDTAQIRSSGLSCNAATEFEVRTWDATNAPANKGFSFLIP